MFSNRFVRGVFAAVLLTAGRAYATSAVVADSQAGLNTAVIKGIVKDSTGAPIPGATIKIVHEVSLATAETVTATPVTTRNFEPASA